MDQSQSSFFSHLFQIKDLREMKSLRKYLQDTKTHLSEDKMTHQQSQTIISNTNQIFEVKQPSNPYATIQEYQQTTSMFRHFKKQILYCFLLYQLEILCKIPILLFLLQMFKKLVQDNVHMPQVYLVLACLFFALQAIINERAQYRVQVLSISMEKYYLKMLLNQIFNNKISNKQQASQSVLNLIDKIDSFLKSKLRLIFKGLAIPLGLSGLTCMMVYILGWFWLVGTFFIIFVQYFQYSCLKFQSCAQSPQKWKNKRQQLFKKAFYAYKWLFMINWTDLIIQKLQNLRAKEISVYHRYYFIIALRFTLNYGLPSTILLLVLGLTSRVSDMDFIVINFAILSSIQFCYLTKDFSNALLGLTQYENLTLQIQQFYLKIQKKQSVLSLFSQIKKNPEDNINTQKQNSLIQFHQVSIYSQINNIGQKFIEELDLQIKKGDIVPIVIENKKQKDIFLNCLTVQGQNFDGTIMITGQQSFAIADCLLIQGSLKENILLGRQLNQQYYRKVIKACSLQECSSDINIDTQQRFSSILKKLANRVSLARCLYQPRQLVIIDDLFENIDVEPFQKLISFISSLNQECNTSFIILLNSRQKARILEQVFMIQNKKLSKVNMNNFNLLERKIEKSESNTSPLLQSQKEQLLKIFGKGNLQRFKDNIEDSEYNFWSILTRYLFHHNNCKFIVVLTLVFYALAQICLSLVLMYINKYYMLEKGQLSPLGNYTQFWAYLSLLAFLNTSFHFIRIVLLGYTLQRINSQVHNEIVGYSFSNVSNIEQVFQNKYQTNCFLLNLSRLDSEMFSFLNMFFCIIILAIILFVYFSVYNPYLLIFGFVLSLPIYLWNRYTFSTLQFCKITNKKHYQVMKYTFGHTIKSLLQIRVNNYQDFFCAKINSVIQQYLHSKTIYTKFSRVYQSYTQYYCFICVVGMFFGALQSKNLIWISQYMMLAIYLLDRITFIASSFGQSTELLESLQCLYKLKQRIVPKYQKIKQENWINQKQKSKYQINETSQVIDQIIKQEQKIQKRVTQATEFMNKQLNIPTISIKRNEKVALITTHYQSILQVIFKIKKTQNFKLQFQLKHSNILQIEEQISHFSLIDLNSSLFFEEVKNNIDPYNICKQQKLGQIIKRVGFHNHVFHNSSQIDSFLDTNIGELSVENRNEIKLCRAVLQDREIIIIVDKYGNQQGNNFMLLNKVAQLFKSKTILYLLQDELDANCLKVDTVYELDLSSYQIQKLK